MKIYKHTGNGHYIGSCILITANSRSEARRIIRGILDKNGLKKEQLSLDEYPIDTLGVIHVANGDY